jgi:hypothetical protein
MNIRFAKTWAAALGLALAVSTAGGVALAVGPVAQRAYEGGNATVSDPNNIGVALKLYDVAGNLKTSGSTTGPLAAYAAADGTVRAGDEYASLFVHLPQSSTAPGAWPGVQATGTDKYAGAGSLAGPGQVAGKPFVRTTADGYSLADVAASLPNAETSDSFVGLYELRLRTSSATAGVADQYAVTYLKVTGNTWTVAPAPALGGGGGPGPVTPVGTSVTPTWPSGLTYGTAATVGVTVSPASGAAKPTGTVRLVSGSTTLSSATLSASGTATLSVAKTALAPGSAALKVVYPGAAGAFDPSESSIRTLGVAKATPSQPTFKATTKPTPKKKGAASITIAVPGGLVAASGRVQVVISKGNVKKTVAGTVKAGAATIKLPKLPVGKWTVVVTYQGDTYYVASTSKSYKLKVK